MEKSKLEAKNKRWWLFSEKSDFPYFWFNFLEWVFITGGLSYLKKLTDNKWVEWFYHISMAALYLFVQSQIGKILSNLLDVSEIFVKNKKMKLIFNILSAIISIFLTAMIYKAINNVINELQTNPL